VSDKTLSPHPFRRAIGDGESDRSPQIDRTGYGLSMKTLQSCDEDGFISRLHDVDCTLKEAINDGTWVIDACSFVAHQTGDVDRSLIRLRVCWLDDQR